MQQRYPLLRILADGQFHSGVALGAALGMGRSAVWKHLHALAEWDIDLHAVPGKGYRLARPLELLDHDLIINALPATAAAALSGFEIHQDIDSTNRYLMNKARLGAPSAQVFWEIIKASSASSLPHKDNDAPRCDLPAATRRRRRCHDRCH